MVRINKKTADLFMRLEDEKFKDKLMEKANNDAVKFTVKFFVEYYKKMRAGARESWQRVKDYGTINRGAKSVSDKPNNNKNNSNKSGRVAKTTDSNGEKKESRDHKCTKCGHFHR